MRASYRWKMGSDGAGRMDADSDRRRLFHAREVAIGYCWYTSLKVLTKSLSRRKLNVRWRRRSESVGRDVNRMWPSRPATACAILLST